MKIKFLKADHGDSILISFDENEIRRNILIDGGPGTAYKEKDRRTGRYIAKVLQKELARVKNNNEKIDLLILTHVDDDHIDGILKWFESSDFNSNMVGEVWFNSGRTIFEYFKKKEIKENLRILDGSEGNYTSIKQGETFEDYIEEHEIWGKDIIKAGNLYSKFGAEFRILSPSKDKLKKLLTKWKKESKDTFTGAKKNDYKLSIDELLSNDKFSSDRSKHNGSSIAFVMTLNNSNFIFLGDAHVKPVVDSLKNLGYSANNPVKSELVKVSHHGSKANTSNTLLKMINTDTYIICTNGKHHCLPNKRCLARIIKTKPNSKIFFNYSSLIDEIFSQKEFNNYAFEAKGVDDLEFEI